MLKQYTQRVMRREMNRGCTLVCRFPNLFFMSAAYVMASSQIIGGVRLHFM